jgi:hypothetical protein
MLIVNDIQDTITMKNKLSSLLRRSNTFGMSRHDIQIELDMIITDLMINEARKILKLLILDPLYLSATEC